MISRFYFQPKHSEFIVYEAGNVRRQLHSCRCARSRVSRRPTNRSIAAPRAHFTPTRPWRWNITRPSFRTQSDEPHWPRPGTGTGSPEEPVVRDTGDQAALHAGAAIVAHGAPTADARASAQVRTVTPRPATPRKVQSPHGIGIGAQALTHPRTGSPAADRISPTMGRPAPPGAAGSEPPTAREARARPVGSPATSRRPAPLNRPTVNRISANHRHQDHENATPIDSPPGHGQKGNIAAHFWISGKKKEWRNRPKHARYSHPPSNSGRQRASTPGFLPHLRDRTVEQFPPPAYDPNSLPHTSHRDGSARARPSPSGSSSGTDGAPAGHLAQPFGLPGPGRHPRWRRGRAARRVHGPRRGGRVPARRPFGECLERRQRSAETVADGHRAATLALTEPSPRTPAHGQAGRRRSHPRQDMRDGAVPTCTPPVGSGGVQVGLRGAPTHPDPQSAASPAEPTGHRRRTGVTPGLLRPGGRAPGRRPAVSAGQDHRDAARVAPGHRTEHRKHGAQTAVPGTRRGRAGGEPPADARRPASASTRSRPRPYRS